uniref:Uncharacterized protein n=1 Tax=Rhizophora mucronata TaxID=61149 RepID=A0A2P2PSI5_RHIMU
MMFHWFSKVKHENSIPRPMVITQYIQHQK